jgi:hypothetical protein
MEVQVHQVKVTLEVPIVVIQVLHTQLVAVAVRALLEVMRVVLYRVTEVLVLLLQLLVLL